jgi:hypothetical protein
VPAGCVRHVRLAPPRRHRGVPHSPQADTWRPTGEKV